MPAAATPTSYGARLAADGKGHPTPKVDVRARRSETDAAASVRPGALGRRLDTPEAADIGEPLAGRRVARAREESGWEARAAKLFAVHDRDRHNFPPHPQHIYKLFFLCELTADAPSDAPTTRWTMSRPSASATRSSSSPRPVGSTQPQLEAAFAHYDDRSLPTEFD